jgi:hypothetical protein
MTRNERIALWVVPAIGAAFGAVNRITEVMRAEWWPYADPEMLAARAVGGAIAGATIWGCICYVVILWRRGWRKKRAANTLRKPQVRGPRVEPSVSFSQEIDP